MEGNVVEVEGLKGSPEKVEDVENGSDVVAAKGSDFEVEKVVANGSVLGIEGEKVLVELGTKDPLILGVNPAIPTPDPVPITTPTGTEVAVSDETFCLAGRGRVWDNNWLAAGKEGEKDDVEVELKEKGKEEVEDGVGVSEELGLLIPSPKISTLPPSLLLLLLMSSPKPELLMGDCNLRDWDGARRTVVVAVGGGFKPKIPIPPLVFTPGWRGRGGGDRRDFDRGDSGGFMMAFLSWNNRSRSAAVATAAKGAVEMEGVNSTSCLLNVFTVEVLKLSSVNIPLFSDLALFTDPKISSATVESVRSKRGRGYDLLLSN